MKTKTTKSTGRKSTSKRMTTADVNELITNKFIQAIEAGSSPWIKPWGTQNGSPRNIEGRKYRGANYWLAFVYCEENNWDHPVFVTFKKAKELGYTVKKGSKSVKVVYSSLMVPKEFKDCPDQCPAEDKFFMRKLYSVFNVAQLEGYDLDQLKVTTQPNEALEVAEAISCGFVGAPKVINQGEKAFYNIDKDFVQIPKITYFESSEAYYKTLFHELAHSTGSAKRLNRQMANSFGSDDYAFEELVAELTASFLASEAGILDATFENSASYLAHWLGKFKDDSSYLIKAMSKAQLASDHILNVKF